MATASWSILEGTWRVRCTYCMHGSPCHSSYNVPSTVFQLAVATAALSHMRPTKSWLEESGCVYLSAAMTTANWSSCAGMLRVRCSYCIARYRDVIQYGQNFLKCFEISWKKMLSYSFVQARISRTQGISWKITSLMVAPFGVQCFSQLLQLAVVTVILRY